MECNTVRHKGFWDTTSDNKTGKVTIPLTPSLSKLLNPLGPKSECFKLTSRVKMRSAASKRRGRLSENSFQFLVSVSFSLLVFTKVKTLKFIYSIPDPKLLHFSR